MEDKENVNLQKKIFFFKTSYYEGDCHWYQNKISEIHQIKIIMKNLQKDFQNVTHVTYGIAL